MSDTKRKLAAIVFTDIVGFTNVSSKNEPAALALLEKQSAHDVIQVMTKPMSDEFKQKFMDYPISNQIMKEYGRVVS